MKHDDGEIVDERDADMRPTTLLPDGRRVARDYTADEIRVCDYLQSIAPAIGCGADPIGFLIASHRVLASLNRELYHRLDRQMKGMSAGSVSGPALAGPSKSG